MIEWFDELSKRLANGQSRRGALRWLGRGALGAGLVSMLPPGRALADDGNSACAHFCNEIFPPGPDRGNCKSAAAQGRGPCYTCGPAAPTMHPDLCGQACCPAGTPNCCSGKTCVSLASDVTNCGTCGTVCRAPANASPVCSGGKCAFTCNPGYTNCRGVCVNEKVDASNCGACGTVCTAPPNATATCTNGVCGFTCNSGFKPCNGACISATSCCTAADCPVGPANSTPTCTNGTCGFTCNTGFTNCGGTCATCPAGGVCSGATCVCRTGQTNCNGTCVDLLGNQSNCGACARYCPGDCVNGLCIIPPPPANGTTTFASFHMARPPGVDCRYHIDCYSGVCANGVCA